MKASMLARMAGSAMVLCLLVVVPGRAVKADGPKKMGTHAGGVASIDYSPDGRYLATAGGDKCVRLWDAGTGRLLRECPGPSSFACAVRFSPDGKWIAVAGYETSPGNPILLIDVATGKQQARLPGHSTGGIRRITFTPDGKRLISGGFDGTVRVWDLASSHEVGQIKVEAGTIYCLALSRDGQLLCTAGREGTRLWDLTTLREVPRPCLNKHSSVAVALSPDGKVLASGDGNTVKLWEVATGREIQTLGGFRGELAQILFSRDGRLLVTASYDRAVRLWEVRTGRMIWQGEKHTGWVWGIALSPDQRHLASCSVDTQILLWDLNSIGQNGTSSSSLSPEQAQTHLGELTSNDASQAYKAVCALAGDPARTLPLLQQRLTSQRMTGPSQQRINQLIADLDSDVYAVRERASDELTRIGVHALRALQEAFVRTPSPEVRRRVNRLLARLDPTELPPETLLALRSVQVLEYVGDEQARRLLEQLAREGNGTHLADEAGRAMQRLAQLRGPR